MGEVRVVRMVTEVSCLGLTLIQVTDGTQTAGGSGAEEGRFGQGGEGQFQAGGGGGGLYGGGGGYTGWFYNQSTSTTFYAGGSGGGGSGYIGGVTGGRFSVANVYGSGSASITLVD